MKIYYFLLLVLYISLSSFAGNQINYKPLDKSNPIFFGGDYIVYKGAKIYLGNKTFFVDGRLTDVQTEKYPFVFNSINKALEKVTDGSESEPMTLYIAPYVYWIDDPDDPEVRKPVEGAIPYGLKVKCNWLRFYGLTDDPRNVILASQRGQTQGAEGNFTMFYFDGDGISSENITFGNYCNVDLEYPLNSKLERPKRSSTITQAQLIICNSDKVIVRNTHFISRLNLCPFAGAKRIIFDHCYFESTDDALCGTGVYLNSKFTFFSSKPFYSTQGTGAVFLNCDINVLTQNRQYLTKVSSPVAMVDSRFHHNSDSLFIGWTQDPTNDLRCYQYNLTLNGAPVLINEDKSWLTVDMTGKPVLSAYRIQHKGKIIYNTYNLLRGNDDWDPMKIKEEILEIERETGKQLSNIPTYLKIQPPFSSIESGVTDLKLSAITKRFGNIEESGQSVKWFISPEYKDLVSIDQEVDGTCRVKGTNENDDTWDILIQAYTPLGTESASTVTVSPKYIDAPLFVSSPEIILEKGKLSVKYELQLEGRTDESLITWYRCSNASGSQAIPVAVSRLNKPLQDYILSNGDLGYYIMASIAPKHLRSHPGNIQTVITSKPITQNDIIDTHGFYTDFINFPTNYQPEIMPGFWTVDGYKPLDLNPYGWEAAHGETWYYGKGIDGMKGNGLVQKVRGARILYTPVNGTYKNMSVTLNVDPGKQAGQGFGSATGQYMDIYIKFDTRTLSGYALRIIRTVKYDNAVDFILMKYENGLTTAITEPVSAVCYRTDCTIELTVRDNVLSASVETKTPLPEFIKPELQKSVYLQAEITPNNFGGTGIQHTGSAGASATMIHWLKVDWE